MKEVLQTALGLYCVLFGITLVFGTMEGLMKLNNTCETNLSRLEYVMPAYRLGCWLGSKPGDK